MPGNLTLRSACFVNLIGDDAAGLNAVGAPYSRLTIAAALADLAANYPAASAASPHIVSLGPGQYTTPAFALPPWVYIQGTADTEGRALSTINLTGDITLDSTFAANATAACGLSDLIIRAGSGTPHLDFTMPAPSSGNPSRTVKLRNLVTDLDLINFQATSTADAIGINDVRHDGNLTQNVTLQGGTQTIDNFSSKATVTLSSTATIAATILGTNDYFAALVLTKNAAAFTSSFSADSIPPIASFTANGGATYTRLNDAYAEGYTPATPANWSPVPATVQAALDELAAGGGVYPANGYATATNNAGNTTITPTAHNYFLALSVTGAARTSVGILAIPASAAAGDRIFVGVTFPATANIVLELRNATAGGTLVYTFTTDGATLSGLFQFVYTGAAWTFAGYQIPYQS